MAKEESYGGVWDLILSPLKKGEEKEMAIFTTLQGRGKQVINYLLVGFMLVLVLYCYASNPVGLHAKGF